MLQRLDEIGYVNTEKNEEGDKRLNLYVPLVKGEEKAERLRKNSFQQDSKPKLQKGFETWKQTIGISSGFDIYKNISDKAWREADLTFTELEDAVVEDKNFSAIVNPDKIPIVVNEESGSETKKDLETSGKPVLQQDSANSQGPMISGVIGCPHCARKNMKMVFASEADLQFHLIAWHSGQGDYVR